MKIRTLAPAAALFLVASLPAFADDLFTLTDGTNTIKFTLPASPTLVQTGVCAGDINLACALNVPVTANGTTTTQPYIAFYDAADLGGLTIGTSTGTLLSQYNTVLFNGSVTLPTFKLMTFNLTNYTGFTSTYQKNFTLTISSTTPGTVPEPSSMVLLGTGMLGLSKVLRRRFA